MKNLWFICLFLFSCSTPPRIDKDSRVPNSEVYSCQVEEQLSGASYKFKFIPDDHLLLVSGTGIQDARIEMAESDFMEGGYVYKSAVQTRPDWSVILNFVSYKNRPQLKVILLKSPISKAAMAVEKSCSH